MCVCKYICDEYVFVHTVVVVYTVLCIVCVMWDYVCSLPSLVWKNCESLGTSIFTRVMSG